MIKAKNAFVLPHRLILGIVLFFTAGCHVISKQVRTQVNPSVSFQEIAKDPEKFKGQTVILSGVLIETTNTKEGTLIKVLQRPAGFRGQPKDTDETGGRFLALDDRYLDTAVYSKDREVTIAGEVVGKKVLPAGEIEYTYPVIHVKEMYLWPVQKIIHDHYDNYYPFWWSYPQYIIVRDHCDKK